ncbi:MAG TPA: class I SAM-dependent methyltransferase [Rhodopila sp.]
MIAVAQCRIVAAPRPEGHSVIHPKKPQSTAAVAAHYDELDSFYREIWGEHVHHGYWPTGRESAAQAAVALVQLLAECLRLSPGQRVCDIGCGYGETARFLAARHAINVTGVTISAVQARRAEARSATPGRVSVQVQDWLTNRFASQSFDRAYAIESSEHMTDKQRFFQEAFRTLRPNGVFVVCAWLARREPRPWEIRYLLEPICREGRLPGLGDEADYRLLAEHAGFNVLQVKDISDQVSRTWAICIRRMLGKFFTQPRYLRLLLNGEATNRIFALTMMRILIAYRTRSMRYCVLVFRRP